MQGLKILISDNGIGVIEFHNAKNIIKNSHYDYIYHEHIFYFTLTSINNVLKNNGLYGFDFFKSPISGGSFVILFKNKKTIESENFKKMIKNEKKLQINSVIKWKKLNKICIDHKTKLNSIIRKFSTKRNIAAYGASARSSTLINYLNLNNKIIKKVFDLNSLKSNLYTPGTHIIIKKPRTKDLNKFNLIILLAWNFKEEILNYLKKLKFKGEIIIPLPKIKIIKLKNENY